MPDEKNRRDSNAGKPEDPAQNKKQITAALYIAQAFLDKYSSNNEQDKRESEVTRKWIKRAAVASILTTVVTAVIMFGGIYQVHIARDTEIHQLQAYIGVVDTKVTCCDQPQLFKHPNVSEEGIVVEFSIKNGGLTPAHDVTLRTQYFEIEGGTQLPRGVVAQHAQTINGKDSEAFPTDTNVYVLQGDERAVSVVGPTMSFVKEKVGLTTMVIYGYVKYTTIFDDVRFTYFCRTAEVGPDKRQFVKDCPDYNFSR